MRLALPQYCSGNGFLGKLLPARVCVDPVIRLPCCGKNAIELTVREPGKLAPT